MATAEANIQNKIRKGKKTSERNLEEYVEILDENADVEQIKLSSEEDLESLLKLAEKLKDNVENTVIRRFLNIFRGLQVFSVILIVPVLYFSYLYWQILGKLNSIVVIITLFLAVALIISAQFEIKKIKSMSLADKLALREVLQLLREVQGTIAEREDWSILKRAEFRIRLSRFDLSEKKDSVFSFFS